jgi:hypothetical protein
MGNFYTNITLLGPDQDQVVEYLDQQGLTAYISPTDEHATVVYEAQCDTQDTEVLEGLAAKLAAHFNCPALAILNHDDDVLWYRLYTGNGLLDEYDSTPGYFEGDDTPPNGGNAAELCRTCGAEQNVAMVEEILRADDEGYLFAVERHEALVDALGLTDFSVGFGYTYLERGEVPEGMASEDLKYTGKTDIG